MRNVLFNLGVFFLAYASVFEFYLTDLQPLFNYNKARINIIVFILGNEFYIFIAFSVIRN